MITSIIIMVVVMKCVNLGPCYDLELTSSLPSADRFNIHSKEILDVDEALLTKEKGATVEQVYSKLFKFLVRSRRADNTGIHRGPGSYSSYQVLYI